MKWNQIKYMNMNIWFSYIYIIRSFNESTYTEKASIVEAEEDQNNLLKI